MRPSEPNLEARKDKMPTCCDAELIIFKDNLPNLSYGIRLSEHASHDGVAGKNYTYITTARQKASEKGKVPYIPAGYAWEDHGSEDVLHHKGPDGKLILKRDHVKTLYKLPPIVVSVDEFKKYIFENPFQDSFVYENSSRKDPKTGRRYYKCGHARLFYTMWNLSSQYLDLEHIQDKEAIFWDVVLTAVEKAIESKELPPETRLPDTATPWWLGYKQ